MRSDVGQVRRASATRIAYVIGGLGKGGAEQQLFHLVRHLDRSRFAATVYVLEEGGFWAEPIRRAGMAVVEMPRRGSGDISRLRRLRRALRSECPDILHTIRWAGNGYGRLAAIGLDIPIVIASERVLTVERPAWQVGVERLLDRVTDAHIVNCEAIAAGLAERERIARAKITVVPNGIDVHRMPFVADRRAARGAAGLAPERPLVAQVGRLTAQKDHPTFLGAAAVVAERRRDVDFLVVGEGPLRGELESFAQTLGLGERVRFTGLRHDVPALLQGVDVLALTSRFEGFPNVLLEAMASGAVAVATDVGGCRELVVPEVSGLLVPPGDPRAVAAAILRVLGDRGLATRLAREARRAVESRFTVEAMAQRTMEIYASLLEAKGIARAA